MALNSGRSKLSAARKKLHVAWERTLPIWDDSVRRQFEDRYLCPLEPKLRASLRAMEEMSALLRKAEADCE